MPGSPLKPQRFYFLLHWPVIIQGDFSVHLVDCCDTLSSLFLDLFICNDLVLYPKLATHSLSQNPEQRNIVTTVPSQSPFHVRPHSTLPIFTDCSFKHPNSNNTLTPPGLLSHSHVLISHFSLEFKVHHYNHTCLGKHHPLILNN